MKTILLLLLVAASLTMYAQEPYKTLQECKNDTLQYIAYNFEQNQSRYIGKKMQFLLDEIDIPLMTKYIMVSDKGPWVGYKISSLSMHYLPIFMDYKKLGKVVYAIKIIFDPSSFSNTRDDFDNKFLDEEGLIVPWNEELYHFFKDYTIKDIWVKKYPMDE